RSVPNGIATALDDRLRQAKQNPQQLGAELGAAAVLGCAAGLITRNPAILGESLVPALTLVQQYGGKALLGATVIDLTGRVAMPVAETWNDPTDSKDRLGRNLVNATFDYVSTGIAGGAGFAA